MARCCSVAAGRKVHTIGARLPREHSIAVQCHLGLKLLRAIQKLAQQRGLLRLRQIFFTQAEPAAAC